MSNEWVRILWTSDVLSKLLHKQVGDGCEFVFAHIVGALVHVCKCGQMNELGMMEETKWASNEG